MASVRGGQKFEAALRTLARNVSRPGTLRVGFLAGSLYPDGTPVAMIAAIHDGGAPGAGIPPRPFFRQMVAEKRGEWPGAIAGLLRDNDYDAPRALAIAGEAIAGQLRQSITDFSGTPLKPATIARKGHSKQLIETGHLLGSVSYEVQS